MGIGTGDPQGALDVNGPILQRGGDLHADYVFEDDYPLESIEEHSESMWREKHRSDKKTIKAGSTWSTEPACGESWKRWRSPPSTSSCCTTGITAWNANYGTSGRSCLS